MNRLAVLAAALATLGGTGCVVKNDCKRTVSVGWPYFVDYTGAHAGCGGLDVTRLEVFVGNESRGFVTCATGPGRDAGVDISDVGRGETITIEGLDANDNIIVRDWFTATGECTDELTTAYPAEGRVKLEYDFYENGVPYDAAHDVCVAGSRLWLQVTDLIANVPAYRFTGANPSEAPICESTQRTLSLPLAAGSYRLDWIEEHDYPHGQALTAAMCSPIPFGIDPGLDTTKAVALDVATGACPK